MDICRIERSAVRKFGRWFFAWKLGTEPAGVQPGKPAERLIGFSRQFRSLTEFKQGGQFLSRFKRTSFLGKRPVLAQCCFKCTLY